MGGNEDETALRDDYMFKLNAYKNMKKTGQANLKRNKPEKP
jgi:hypothetical protein